jgi:hypothetical protein
MGLALSRPIAQNQSAVRGLGLSSLAPRPNGPGSLNFTLRDAAIRARTPLRKSPTPRGLRLTRRGTECISGQARAGSLTAMLDK